MIFNKGDKNPAIDNLLEQLKNTNEFNIVKCSNTITMHLDNKTSIIFYGGPYGHLFTIPGVADDICCAQIKIVNAHGNIDTINPNDIQSVYGELADSITQMPVRMFTSRLRKCKSYNRSIDGRGYVNVTLNTGEQLKYYPTKYGVRVFVDTDSRANAAMIKINDFTTVVEKSDLAKHIVPALKQIDVRNKRQELIHKFTSRFTITKTK